MLAVLLLLLYHLYLCVHALLFRQCPLRSLLQRHILVRLSRNIKVRQKLLVLWYKVYRWRRIGRVTLIHILCNGLH